MRTTKITIDLENRGDSSLQNIFTTWGISFPPKEYPWYKNFMRLFEHVDKVVYVGVKDIQPDRELLCAEDKYKLFLIQYGEIHHQLEDPLRIDLTQEKTSFQLFIDSSQIYDCLERQCGRQEPYHIRAKVYIQNENYETISEEDIDVKVEFKDLKIEPCVKIYLDSRNIPGGNIQYSSDLNKLKIGTVSISYKKDWLYAPEINLKTQLRLTIGGVPRDNILSVYENVDGNEIKKSGNLITIDNNRNFDKSYILKLDFSQLINPVSNTKVCIKNISSYSLAYNPNVQIPLFVNANDTFDAQKVFTLCPDPQGTELQVKHSFAKGAEQQDLNGGATNLDRFEFVAGDARGIGARLEISFLNLATDTSNPRAGVVIRHLVVRPELNVNVVDRRGRNLAADRIISVSGDTYQRMSGPSGYTIPNGRESKSILRIDFSPFLIDDITNCPSYEFNLVTTVSFDYWENRNGESDALFEQNKKRYTHTYVWKLYQLPNIKWLCVDYGTSAIVCKYGDDIIDLKTQKGKLIKQDEDYKKLSKDSFEEGTTYLSSDIIFHSQAISDSHVSSLSSEQTSLVPYSKLAVCLSPTSKMVIDDILHQLPCLKLLIGHKYLPQPENSHALNIQYYRKDSKGNVTMTTASYDDEEENSILK
ncbi:MAG: hypothetical protein LUD48_06530, partial [Prevotella sp.]|nr:hypothetical protein [Prevotella sp.]